MSKKELDRLTLLSHVQAKKVTQVRAAELLGLSERQIRNLLRSLRNFGPEGLISKKRGKSSNRCLNPIIRQKAIALVREKYCDFAPTLAAEKLLEQHQMRISRETLRQWMIDVHLWIPKVNRKKLHPLRRPRECFGEMLQGDGSHHDWFETGKPCVLTYFIDDATGKITAGRFEKGENLDGYFKVLLQHLEFFGVPLSLYTDRFSVFETSLKKENLTQFRRALHSLGIKWIGANSPQAKGKIERCNRTLQDRLVKEMRIRGIKTIEEGNQFLENFWPIYNSKFSKEPMKTVDLHRPLERGIDLSRILSKYEERTLTKDLLFQFHNKHYQILEITNGRVRGEKVEIRTSKEGEIRVFSGNNELKVKSLDQIEKEVAQVVDLEKRWPNKQPRAQNRNHPWRELSYRRGLKKKKLKAYAMV